MANDNLPAWEGYKGDALATVQVAEHSDGKFYVITSRVYPMKTQAAAETMARTMVTAYNAELGWSLQEVTE